MVDNSSGQKQTESSRPVASRSPANDSRAASFSGSTSPQQSDRVITEQILSKADNKRQLNELLHTNYPENKIVDYYLTLGFNPYGGNMVSLSELSDQYPVECLRKTSGDSLYCVYKTKEGGRFYLFFFPLGDNWVYNYSLYSKKALRYADFCALKVGDPLSAVERIDPACSLYRPVYPLKQIITRHLLGDGILTIDYSRDNMGNYFITKLTYNKDFQFKGSRIDKSGSRLTENCAILPQDYIH